MRIQIGPDKFIEVQSVQDVVTAIQANPTTRETIFTAVLNSLDLFHLLPDIKAVEGLANCAPSDIHRDRLFDELKIKPHVTSLPYFAPLFKNFGCLLIAFRTFPKETHSKILFQGFIDLQVDGRGIPQGNSLGEFIQSATQLAPAKETEIHLCGQLYQYIKGQRRSIQLSAALITQLIKAIKTIGITNILPDIKSIEFFADCAAECGMQDQLFACLQQSPDFSTYITNPLALVTGFRAFPKAEQIEILFKNYLLKNILKGQTVEVKDLDDVVKESIRLVPKEEAKIQLCKHFYNFAFSIASNSFHIFILNENTKTKFKQNPIPLTIALIRFFHDIVKIVPSRNADLCNHFKDFYDFLRSCIPNIDSDPKVPKDVKEIPESIRNIKTLPTASVLSASLSNALALPAAAQHALSLKYGGYVLNFQRKPNNSPGLCLAESIGVADPKNRLQEISAQLASQTAPLSLDHPIIYYLSKALYQDLTTNQLQSNLTFFANRNDNQGRNLVDEMNRRLNAAQYQTIPNPNSLASRQLQAYLADPSVLHHYVEYLLHANYYNATIGELLLNYPIFDPENIIHIGIVKQTSNGSCFINPLADGVDVFNVKPDGNNVGLIPNPKVKWVILHEPNPNNYSQSHYDELKLLEIKSAVINTPIPTEAIAIPPFPRP